MAFAKYVYEKSTHHTHEPASIIRVTALSLFNLPVGYRSHPTEDQSTGINFRGLGTKYVPIQYRLMTRS